MLRLITVHRTERVALVRNGTFERLLRPGIHLVWTLGLVELVRLDISSVVTRAEDVDVLPDELHDATLFTVRGTERVLVEGQGSVRKVLAPGRYRLWDVHRDVTLRRIDLNAEPTPLQATDRIVGAVMGAFVEKTATDSVAVVLLRDGQPVRRLDKGRYRAWTGGPWGLEDLPLGLAPVELAAQDLVTGDQVPVRVKAAGTVRVADPVKVMTERRGHEMVYAAIHIALREVVSTKTFDALMADRDALSGQLLNAARAKLADVGLALVEAHVKDVILSAEVKALVNRVTFARKEAEAVAIKRREEVASTRQLANTAKLLQSNPVLLRLKELEALGEVVHRVDKLVVVGSAGEIANQLMLRELQ